MFWITLRTTSGRWEAELMQQILTAHQIQSRIIDLGSLPYLGLGSPAALQVQADDRWTATLLLSPIEDAETQE